MNQFKKWLITCLSVSIILLSIFTVKAEINYDVTHEDPENDVQLMADDGWETVQGRDDVDIVSVKSSKRPLKQNVLLEMRVVGTIKVSENISYSFTIMDGEEMVYMAHYMNGICTGMNFADIEDEPEDDVLAVSGAGTDTLMVTIPIEKLGSISSYDIMGQTGELLDDGDMFYIYMDSVPDMEYPDDYYDDYYDDRPIVVTEPTNGTTVFNIIDVRGTTDYTESVEIRIDPTSSSGWFEPETSDNWSSWNWEWDTTSVPNGKHVICARAYDGDQYYFDNITVFVNQDTAESPKTVNMTTFSIGDRYEYNMIMVEDEFYDAEDMTMSGSLIMELKEMDSLLVDGVETEVYVFETHGVAEFGSGIFTEKSTMDGRTWLRKSDLAMVKEEMNSEENSGGFGDSEQYSYSEIATYDPPKNNFDFPMAVSEKWESTYDYTAEYTDEYDGETDTYTETYTGTTRFECLRNETVEVPAGIFEVFLIYESEEEMEWDEEDWEDDDWADDDWEDEGWDDDGGDNYSEVEVVYVDEYGYSGYTINYYSPELGCFAKIEEYDHNRVLLMVYDLVGFKRGENVSKPPDDEPSVNQDRSFEIPFTYVMIIIGACLVVLALLLALLIVRRRRKQPRAHFKVEMTENGPDEEPVKFQIIEDVGVERNDLSDQAKK